jgi:hypothetical protein
MTDCILEVTLEAKNSTIQALIIGETGRLFPAYVSRLLGHRPPKSAVIGLCAPSDDGSECCFLDNRSGTCDNYHSIGIELSVNGFCNQSKRERNHDDWCPSYERRGTSEARSLHK